MKMAVNLFSASLFDRKTNVREGTGWLPVSSMSQSSSSRDVFSCWEMTDDFLPETNMAVAPENGWQRKTILSFLGWLLDRCHVSLREGRLYFVLVCPCLPK